MDFIPEKKNEVPATHRMFAHVSSLRTFFTLKKNERESELLPPASGKVMFSQLCVKNSVHKGVYFWLRGVYTYPHPPPPRPLQTENPLDRNQSEIDVVFTFSFTWCRQTFRARL